MFEDEVSVQLSAPSRPPDKSFFVETGNYGEKEVSTHSDGGSILDQPFHSPCREGPICSGLFSRIPPALLTTNRLIV